MLSHLECITQSVPIRVFDLVQKARSEREGVSTLPVWGVVNVTQDMSAGSHLLSQSKEEGDGQFLALPFETWSPGACGTWARWLEVLWEAF